MCLVIRRFLHTAQPDSVLAGLANCALPQLRSARKDWVPQWEKIATPLTRLTWLGSFPKVFEQMQPARKVDTAATVDRVEDQERAGDAREASNGNADDSSDEDGNNTFNFNFVAVDGKVFVIENSQTSSLLRRASFSAKTKTSGFQTLVWSMPCGTPILVTGLFAAKLSEKKQVALHSGWLVALPPNVAVLADRGFRRLQRHYPKYVVRTFVDRVFPLPPTA